MQFQFSFKHMDSSDALQSYAEKKVTEKIQKFVTKPIEAHLTFSVEKHHHTAKCHLTGGDGFNVEVEHTCDDMYGSVDQMVVKLSSQLKRHKEKLKTHRGTHLGRDTNLADPSVEPEVEMDAAEVIQFEKARKKH